MDLNPYNILYFKDICYKIKSETECYENYNELFNKFPFKLLASRNIVDHKTISILTEILNVFVENPKFIEKIDYCFNNIIDFALYNASSLTKSDTVTNNKLLVDLLKFINNILMSINNNNIKSENYVDSERITELLLELTEKKKSIIKAGGEVLSNLILQPNPSNKMAIVKCISKLFPLLIKSGIIAETNLICIAVLRSKWTYTSTALCSAIIDYALNETNCRIDCQTIIKSLETIYETQDESVCSKFTDILRTNLNFLCQMLSLSEISNDVKLLLIFILRDMHKRLFSNFHENFDYIAWDLPENLEQWPSSNSELFLLLVYCMQLYSSIIWKHTEILEFLVARIFKGDFSLFALKILLQLYPVYSLNQTGQKILLATHILSQLPSERIDCLKEIITFEKIQMTWIFLYAPLLVKVKSFYLWLSVEEDDTKILPALDASGSGNFLLTILFRNCNIPVVSTRCISLLSRLQDPRLPFHASRYIKLSLTEPKIFPYIMQIFCNLKVDKSLSLHCAQTASLILPTLRNKEAVNGACQFSLNLLNTYQNETEVFMQFATNKPAILFLVSVASRETDDTIALNATKVLRALVKLQIKHKIKVETIYLNFCLLLRKGEDTKLLKILDIIYLIFNFPQEGSLFDMKESKSFLNLYFRLQELVLKRSLADLAFNCLRLMLFRERNLADSAASVFFLRSICRRDFNVALYTNSFLGFLRTFLKTIKGQPPWRFPKKELLMVLSVEFWKPNRVKIQSCRNLLKAIPDDDTYYCY